MRIILALSFAALLTACSGGATPSVNSKVDPKTLTNPVPVTPKSVAEGKRLFDKSCASCHGVAGDGVSEAATELVSSGQPRPSNLTDDQWDFGSTDGEIFVVIRDGLGPKGAMRGLNGKPGITNDGMWDLVNYIRSIGPQAK